MVHLGKEEVLELLRYSRVSIVPHQKKKNMESDGLRQKVGVKTYLFSFWIELVRIFRAHVTPKLAMNIF